MGDQYRFPARPIPAGEAATPLPASDDLEADGRAALDELLRETDSSASVVVHRDRLVYERYFGGADRETLEKQLIGDLDDPVTDYLPELAARDARFERIPLRHLLTMSSGIRYSESDLPWPSGDDTYTGISGGWMPSDRGTSMASGTMGSTYTSRPERGA